LYKSSKIASRLSQVGAFASPSNATTPLDGAGAWASAASRSSGSLYQRRGKRVLDVIVAAAMLLALLPLILVLAALVAGRGGAPFFAHRRVGRGGRMFDCYKIRTMVTDAEARLPSILASNPAAAAEWQRDCKLANDPRVTPIGRILRRTSLDELPQLWNVLRGDMSLVGPRPVTAAELDRYGPERDVYLALRPGLTGPWQVAGRNDATYEERVDLDAAYAVSLCLPNDLRIIARTAEAMLHATGR
jgi:lipopolysaccharide/colanic/teichoic acid biosynthesis glycosyltransferase